MSQNLYKHVCLNFIVIILFTDFHKGSGKDPILEISILYSYILLYWWIIYQHHLGELLHSCWCLPSNLLGEVGIILFWDIMLVLWLIIFHFLGCFRFEIALCDHFYEVVSESFICNWSEGVVFPMWDYIQYCAIVLTV